MNNFMQSFGNILAQAKQASESKTSTRTSGGSMYVPPVNGADLRVFANGCVLPSRDLFTKHLGEYLNAPSMEMVTEEEKAKAINNGMDVFPMSAIAEVIEACAASNVQVPSILACGFEHRDTKATKPTLFRHPKKGVDLMTNIASSKGGKEVVEMIKAVFGEVFTDEVKFVDLKLVEESKQTWEKLNITAKNSKGDPTFVRRSYYDFYFLELFKTPEGEVTESAPASEAVEAPTSSTEVSEAPAVAPVEAPVVTDTPQPQQEEVTQPADTQATEPVAEAPQTEAPAATQYVVNPLGS